MPKKPPTKYCPKGCMPGVHVRTAKCPKCGHVWPKKLKDAGPSTPRVSREDPMPTPPRGPAVPVFMGELIAPAGPCPVRLPEIDLAGWFAELKRIHGDLKLSGAALRHWAVKELEYQLYGIRGLILSQYQGDEHGDRTGYSGTSARGPDQGSGSDDE